MTRVDLDEVAHYPPPPDLGCLQLQLFFVCGTLSLNEYISFEKGLCYRNINS